MKSIVSKEMTIVLNTLEPDITSDQVCSFFGKKDSQTEVINTSGMKISHCMGCNHCWLKTPGICAIKDDYEGIIKKLVGAENLWLVSDTRFGFIDWRGIALVVASGLCYTLFIVIVNLSQQVKAIPNLTLTFYCFLIGSVMLFALSGFGVHLNAVPDAVSWLNVLGLAILPTAIATITLAASSKAVGATKTSILGILEPLTAIVIGTLVFHEAFTLNVALGVALILFAILFMILTEKKA